MARDRFGLAALEILLCTMGSIAFGFAYFGRQVFNPELTTSQFMFFGLIAGVFVAASPRLRSRWLFLLGVAAFLGLQLTTKSNTPIRLVRDAIGVVSALAAVKLGRWGNGFFPSLPIGKFVFWATIFAITHACAFLLMVVIKTHSPVVNPEYVVMVARIGALLGAGVGLGDELANIVARRGMVRRDGERQVDSAVYSLKGNPSPRPAARVRHTTKRDVP